jgi:hypothetical protein
MKLAAVFLAVMLTGATLACAQSPSSDSTAQEPPSQASSFNCSDFHRNPDGSWISVRDVTISGPSGSASYHPYAFFPPHVAFVGLDVADILEQQCYSH